MGLSGLPLGAGVLAPPLPRIEYTSQRPTAEELKALHLAAFGVDRNNTPGGATEYLTRRNAIMRFAYDGSRLVGYGAGQDAKSRAYHLEHLRLKPVVDGTFYADLLGTHPDYQGFGIGRSLLEQTLDDARCAGHTHVFAFAKDGRPHRITQELFVPVLRDIELPYFCGKQTYHFVYGRLKRPGRSDLH